MKVQLRLYLYVVPTRVRGFFQGKLTTINRFAKNWGMILTVTNVSGLLSVVLRSSKAELTVVTCQL